MQRVVQFVKRASRVVKIICSNKLGIHYPMYPILIRINNPQYSVFSLPLRENKVLSVTYLDQVFLSAYLPNSTKYHVVTSKKRKWPITSASVISNSMSSLKIYAPTYKDKGQDSRLWPINAADFGFGTLANITAQCLFRLRQRQRNGMFEGLFQPSCCQAGPQWISMNEKYICCKVL